MRLMRIGPVGAERTLPNFSQFHVREPSDVSNKGTPAGVALGPPDHPYLRSGEVMELWIHELGRQRHERGAA